MQQYAVWFILLQNNSTCFGCEPHPSSGVLKSVTAASGTVRLQFLILLMTGAVGTRNMYSDFDVK